MTREEFKKGMNAIQMQEARDKDIAFHLSKAFPESWEANLTPDNLILYEIVFDLLSEFDEEAKDWITYFIYELDWGALNFRMKAYKNDGSEIPLTTVDNLYDFLQSRK